jgi:hypothetical protein
MAGRSARSLGRIAVGTAIMLLAACGSDDADTAGVATSGAPTTATSGAVAGATSTTAAAVARPTSMDEWEALWARQRQAVVQRIEDNGWGPSADGTTMTGPEGFEIDISSCPAGWSDTEGLTDSEVRIGHTIGLSGIYATNGTSDAIRLMLDHYGTTGAFKDSAGATRTVNYLPRDDATDPARTTPLTDELIDSQKVFAQITSASANTFKVYDKLNQRCIPHLVSLSGHPAWGDPVNHPWSTGLVLAYSTESIIWGTFLDQRIDEFPAGKVTVATLALNNDYGKVATDAFKAYLQQSPNAGRYELVSETVELAAPVITDPMTTLASKNPDAFFAMVGGGQCVATINEAAQNGMHASVNYLFLPNICLPSGPVTKDLVGGDGTASDGWWVVNGGGVDIKDPNLRDDAFVAWARELLEAHNHDPAASGSFNAGFADGWILVQALRIAGELPGGLSRLNFALALRAMDMTSPMLLEGMALNMNGNDDAYLLESAVLQKWSSAGQVWENQGKPIDLSGRSTACAWDPGSSVCR